ncbi:MAG: InlB B-repeat-containing protein [Prevotella sp.]|nr:InlB B-repeat-containing protein [Prevotella sp.]MBR6275672.1 InlB B-repeat-containing protein [Prevotella sp.]
MTKRIRYLTMLLALLASSIGVQAQVGSGFNPSDPPEPGQPPMKLEVKVVPAEAGSVSGTGRYAEGTAVNLYAYVNTGFRFTGWTNKAGDVLSTSTNFTYTKLAGHEQLTANYVFDPSNPQEPVEPSMIMYYQLQVNCTEGGSAYGGGRYLANTNVTLTAYPEDKFEFVAWIDDATGETISENSSFTYTTTAKHRSVTARFHFNPDSPAEPPVPDEKRWVRAIAIEGGTTNFASERVIVGRSITLTAYANDGYDFEGWYLNGEEYTKLSSFSYTVTDSYYQDFEARFTFNPRDPSEPGSPTPRRHEFYLMNKVTKPGATVKFPIYLTSIKPLTDMTFQLEFPEVLTPDFTKVEMSEKAVGYSISYSQQDARNYVFTLTGGTVPAGNAALLVFTINVSEDIITALDYPVLINLVEVTEEDGTVVTAGTRNGRLSVYKNGDANGDDVVSIYDAVLVVDNILGHPSDEFIQEAANVNDDEGISIIDAVGVVDIILDDTSGSRTQQTTNEADPD